jgi:hypothetical protein
MNKKQARIEKQKRNAKTNFYIVKLTMSGAVRLKYNFFDKKEAYKMAESLKKETTELFVVEKEKRTKDITY